MCVHAFPPQGCRFLRGIFIFCNPDCSLNVGQINAHFFLDRKENFRTIFLNASYAGLVNEHWDFGKNERSLKYVERCLQNFPGFGVWGPEECPVSWVVMEQSCELRMGYTVPKYRGQGNMWQIAYHFISYLISKNMPFYLHVAEEKEEIQKLMRTVGCKESLCGWHQWICTPKKYC